MYQEKIKDFSEEELDRVFKNCASPIICKRRVGGLIKEGSTLEKIYEGDQNDKEHRLD